MKQPRYEQTFQVGNTYLGSCLRQPKQVHEEKVAPAGVAYFCPVCCNVWAMAGVRDLMTGRCSDFMPYRIPCPAHDTRMFSIPGSLWLPWDEDFNSTLPDDVVAYEFQQAMKLYKDDHE